MIEYTVTVSENGSKFWNLNGKLHREDGPACEYFDGDKFWYLNGEELSEEEFLRKINPIFPELQVIEDLRVVAEKYGYKRRRIKIKIYFMTFKRLDGAGMTYPEIKNHLRWFDPDVVIRPVGINGSCFVATTLDVEVLLRIADVHYIIDVTYSVEEMAKLINSHPEVSA